MNVMPTRNKSLITVMIITMIIIIMTGSAPSNLTAVLVDDMQKEHISYVQSYKNNLGWCVGNHWRGRSVVGESVGC